MPWRGSILVKSVWCPGGFLNGQLFLRIWNFSAIILLNILCIPLACTSSPSSKHDSQVWSFDGVAEFLHIPFAAF
jgi:hypothetical protein